MKRMNKKEQAQEVMAALSPVLPKEKIVAVFAQSVLTGRRVEVYYNQEPPQIMRNLPFKNRRKDRFYVGVFRMTPALPQLIYLRFPKENSRMSQYSADMSWVYNHAVMITLLKDERS